MIGQRPIPINVEKLASVWNPFESVVWKKDLDTPITLEEVEKALEEGRTQKPTVRYSEREGKCSRKMHVERIAWLVEEGWAGPIQVHASGSSVGVIDGNHRLAAAIIRGDDFIYAWIDGSVSRIHELFSRKKAA